MKLKPFLISSIAVLTLLTGLTYISGYSLWGSGFISFFVGMIRNPFRVGAFAPCSRFVGKEITRFVAQKSKEYEANSQFNKPVYALEVGPGSGVLTVALEEELEKLNRNYTLDLIEIDEDYCKLLQEKFGHNKNISIHCMDVVNWNPRYSYDYIISTVPFSNLSLKQINNILKKYIQIIKPDGILSYIEHMWFPNLMRMFIKGQEKKEYEQKLSHLKKFKEQFVMKTKNIWLNITPVYVHHLKIMKGPA